MHLHLIKNEAAGKKQIIVYPPDFKKSHKLYICADTPSNRKLLDESDIDYKIDEVNGTDFITGMDADGDTGTVPYSKFERNTKKAYDAIKAAKDKDKDSIGAKFDIPEMALGFAGIDPAEMEDSDLEDYDSFLGYVWQDLRDICTEYVAHIKDGKVVDGAEYVRAGSLSVAPFPGAK